jgi:hypothetical protein
MQPKAHGDPDMLFEVQLMRGAAKAAQPRVLRTVNFEADDLYSVVSRTHIILSTRGFEPDVDAFRIIVDGNQVVYGERDMIDG